MMAKKLDHIQRQFLSCQALENYINGSFLTIIINPRQPVYKEKIQKLLKDTKISYHFLPIESELGPSCEGLSSREGKPAYFFQCLRYYIKEIKHYRDLFDASGPSKVKYFLAVFAIALKALKPAEISEFGGISRYIKFNRGDIKIGHSIDGSVWVQIYK